MSPYTLHFITQLETFFVSFDWDKLQSKCAKSISVSGVLHLMKVIKQY